MLPKFTRGLLLIFSSAAAISIALNVRFGIARIQTSNLRAQSLISILVVIGIKELPYLRGDEPIDYSRHDTNFTIYIRFSVVQKHS